MVINKYMGIKSALESSLFWRSKLVLIKWDSRLAPFLVYFDASVNMYKIHDHTCINLEMRSMHKF